MAKKEKRFIFKGSAFSEARIIVDRQTGVNYLYVGSGYGGGLTPLLNRDGTPVISSISELEKDEK